MRTSLLFVAVSVLLQFLTRADVPPPTITSISVTQQTQGSGTALGGSLFVSAPPYPLNTSSGAGLLINEGISVFGATEFRLHSHAYDASHSPTNAVLTYGFSSAAVVDSVRVLQHANGITRIEGFVGDSLSELTSVGNVFGPSGDVTGWSVFTEGSSYVFDFGNTIAGRYFQLVITKTSLSDGYAAYSLCPLDASGIAFGPALVPEPSSWLLCAASLAGVLSRRTRRKNTDAP